MVKVVVAKLGRKKAKHPSVVTRTTRGADGTIRQMFSVDANSPTFTDDLTYVFSENVAAARRENKKLFGSADGIRKRNGVMPGSSDARRQK